MNLCIYSSIFIGLYAEYLLTRSKLKTLNPFFFEPLKKKNFNWIIFFVLLRKTRHDIWNKPAHKWGFWELLLQVIPSGVGLAASIPTIYSFRRCFRLTCPAAVSFQTSWGASERVINGTIADPWLKLLPFSSVPFLLCSTQSKLVTVGHYSHTFYAVAAFCCASIIRYFICAGSRGPLICGLKNYAKSKVWLCAFTTRSKSNLWHILKERDAQVHFLWTNLSFFFAPSAQCAISVGCPVELISECVCSRYQCTFQVES